MAPRAEGASPSARSLPKKLQEGRVGKPKAKRGDGRATKTPNYKINGRTFACEGCRNGHRVSKCTHAFDRPLHMTNEPGRPSLDEKRRCNCPKSCSCKTKNCKCDRNCSCTQVMYILVYVPVEDPEKRVGEEKGEWQIEKEVVTDLKANPLSITEIEARARMKTLQDDIKASQRSLEEDEVNASGGKKSPDQDDERSHQVVVNSFKFGGSHTGLLPPKESCCGHKESIRESSPPKKSDSRPTPHQPVAGRAQCDCGIACQCAFCLDHPNNMTSQRIAQQRAVQYAGGWEAKQDRPEDYSQFVAEKAFSCMGTNPQFAFRSTPDSSAIDLQDMFGQDVMTNGGYILRYPIEYQSAAVSQDLSGSTVGPTSSQDSFTPMHINPSDQFRPFAKQRSSFQPPHPVPCSIYDMSCAAVDQPPIWAQNALSSLTWDSSTNLPLPLHAVGEASLVGMYGISGGWPDSMGPPTWTPQDTPWPGSNDSFSNLMTPAFGMNDTEALAHELALTLTPEEQIVSTPLAPTATATTSLGGFDIGSGTDMSGDSIINDPDLNIDPIFALVGGAMATTFTDTQVPTLSSTPPVEVEPTNDLHRDVPVLPASPLRNTYAPAPGIAVAKHITDISTNPTPPDPT